MANSKTGQHPVLKSGAVKKPKPIKLTESERKSARAELDKAKKSPRKGKDVPCY